MRRDDLMKKILVSEVVLLGAVAEISRQSVRSLEFAWCK
jgi:hypothetical protein